jgi:GNAT superfamily N-acetyltransferase
MATQSTPPLEVLVTTDEVLRHQAFSLRYEAWVEEMGFPIIGADHAQRIVRDEWDDPHHSSLLCACSGGRVIATLRILWCKSGFPTSLVEHFGFRKFDVFPQEELSFTTRVIVHKDWRKSTVLPRLFLAGYRLARERGIRFDFGQCAPPLVPMYEKLGYRNHLPGFLSPDIGFQVPLVLPGDDGQYLRRIRSLFASVANEFPSSSDSTEWLMKGFPRAATPFERTPREGVK